MADSNPLFTTFIKDGKQELFADPQHFTGANNEGRARSGEKDPFPTADYGMTAGGVWVPKKVADDGSTLTQLTGSNVEYRKIPLSNDEVIQSGGSYYMRVLANKGKIAELIYYGLRVLPPSDLGATTGTHRLIFGFSNTNTYNRLLDITVAYSSVISITRNMCDNPSAKPSDINIQLAGVMGLVIDEYTELTFFYTNNTDADIQPNKIQGEMFLLEEGI